jgi:hypothetical protein
MWMYAAVVVFFAGAGIGLLALLDHPYSREKALTSECERLAGREARVTPWLAGLRHGLFVSGLVLATGCAVTYFSLEGMRASGSSKDYPWASVLGTITAAVVFSLLATLLLETVSLRFRSSAGRILGGLAAVSILLALFLVPVIHTVQAYSNWRRCMVYAKEDLRLRAMRTANQAKQGNFQYQRQVLARYRIRYDFDLYAEGLETYEAVREREAQFRDAPLRVMWRHHTTALIGYATIFVLLVALIIAFRRWTHRALTEEARKAVDPGGRPRDLPMKPPRPSAEKDLGISSSLAAGGTGAQD